jgi:hypothetical protein
LARGGEPDSMGVLMTTGLRQTHRFGLLLT